eukprot:jgi/Psemu1/283692/fgenesh1_pg.31_\
MNLFKNSKKKSKGKGATATTAAGATAAGAPASTAAAGTAGSKPRKHSTSFFGRKKKTKKQQEPKLQLQLKLQLKQNQEPFGFASQRSLADSDATETATNATVSPRENYDEDLPGNPSNASLDPETIELLRESVASVLAAMEAFPDDDVLLEDACLALEVLTAPTANASKGFGFDLDAKTMQRILQEILLAMEGFADNPAELLRNLRLRVAALEVLKHLSTHPSVEVKGKIVLGGGAAQIVDRLLQVLQQTGKDLIDNNYHVESHTPSLGITCGSVTRANNTAEDIQKQLAKAVKPVLDTILRHPNRTTIRYRGLSCLHKLTLAHADAIANHHGGIPTLLNSELHERVLACLTGLLSPSSNADGLDLVASMQTEDGLDAVFRTVRRYQSRPEVIATALEAIFYLSCRVRVVLASIAGSSPRIRHGVEAEAARNLRAQLCLEENVFVLLGTVQQYLPVNETICQRGLGVLVNIQAFRVAADAADAANAALALRRQQTALAADGGIKLVLAVMRRHGLAVAIQEYGFYDEEGISTVLAAMMIHPDHVAIQSSGCDVLIRMVVPEPRNRFDLLEDDSEALEACAYYKRCLREETDATGTIEAALERFPTNRYLQHRGAVLLKALAVPPSARTRVASAAAASFSTAAVRSSQILSTTASLLSASSSSSSQSRG